MIDQVITFLPNETEKCVTFNIMDDNIALEKMEQLTFNITIFSQVSNCKVEEDGSVKSVWSREEGNKRDFLIFNIIEI